MQRNTTKPGVKSSAKPARTTTAEPTRATQAGAEPESIGKPHQPSATKAATKAAPKTATAAAPAGQPGNAGSERALDEAREGGPRYGGGAWDVADERGERRFGHARNDDGESAGLTGRDAEREPGEQAVADDPELDDVSGEIESGGQHAGMGRGEKPRKLKSEE